MGLHLILYNDAFEQHPDWDDLRHSGDRDVPFVLRETGFDQKLVGHPSDCEYWERSSDPDAFAAAMKLRCPENSSRWDHLAEIFRSSGDWWLYASY